MLLICINIKRLLISVNSTRMGKKKEKKGKIDTFQLKERQAARPHKLPQSSSQLLSPLLVMLPHHSVECNMMQNLDNVTYD